MRFGLWTACHPRFSNYSSCRILSYRAAPHHLSCQRTPVIPKRSEESPSPSLQRKGTRASEARSQGMPVGAVREPPLLRQANLLPSALCIPPTPLRSAKGERFLATLGMTERQQPHHSSSFNIIAIIVQKIITPHTKKSPKKQHPLHPLHPCKFLPHHPNPTPKSQIAATCREIAAGAAKQRQNTPKIAANCR